MKFHRALSGGSMAKFLDRNWSTILLLLGGYYAYSQIVLRGREAIAPVTRPISKILAEIQFAVNGSNYIRYPNAGFYLDPSKLDYTYKVVDMQWLKAMSLTHDDHEDYLNEIFDADLRLKPQYRVLIDGLVDAETITIAAKG